VSRSADEHHYHCSVS